MDPACAGMVPKDHGPDEYQNSEEQQFGVVLSDPSEHAVARTLAKKASGCHLDSD